MKRYRILIVFLPLVFGALWPLYTPKVYGIGDVLQRFPRLLIWPPEQDNGVFMAQDDWMMEVLENYTATQGNLWYKRKLIGLVREASYKYQVSPRLIMSVMAVESAFRRGAVSCVGARGLMQVMPATAAWLKREHKAEYNGKWSLHDERTNIMLGTLYLRLMILQHKNVKTALVAYNHGPGAVSRMEILPTKYTGLVRKVRLSVI